MRHKIIFFLLACSMISHALSEEIALEKKRGLKDLVGVVQEGAALTLSTVTQSMNGIKTELHELKQTVEKLPQKTTEEFHLTPARVALVGLGSVSAYGGLNRFLNLTAPQAMHKLDSLQTLVSFALISAGLFLILKAKSIVNYFNEPRTPHTMP